jgi:regulator of protease activity HflC (stomatin/prohibitin superfamily)
MRNIMTINELVTLIASALFAWIVYLMFARVIKAWYQYVTVYEYQRGLLYKNGKFQKILEGGRYLVFTPSDYIQVIDMRETVNHVINQELICADGLAIRLSWSLIYRVVDPVKVHQAATSYLEVLHLTSQLSMRELVSGLKIEEVMAQRNDISTKFVESMKAKVGEIGLDVISGGIRDVTFPADVKKIYSQVAQAEKSAEATLAKARSETASLRSLANAAKMIEGNPNLLTLRTLQSISDLATTGGNTIVFGMPPNLMPLPTNGEKRKESTSPSTPSIED